MSGGPPGGSWEDLPAEESRASWQRTAPAHQQTDAVKVRLKGLQGQRNERLQDPGLSEAEVP